MRIQRPSSELASPAVGATLDVTDVYYDGVRVVQEVAWSNVPVRPTLNSNGEPDYLKPGLPRRAREIDGDSPIIGNPPPENRCPVTTSSDWQWSKRRLTREYVWAADPGGYVDECVAQYVYTDAHVPVPSGPSADSIGNDTSATLLYVLHDHNANVIALTNALGDVAAQYTYTPYGQVRSVEYAPEGSSLTSAEELAAAKSSPLGHQGLRFERFDKPWDGPLDLTTATPPSATQYTFTTHAGLYFNRNRMYDAVSGRFTSKDPNGLGGAVVVGASFGGSRSSLGMSTDLMAHFGDGPNTHIAYGVRGGSARDPLGLSWDPFVDFVDTYQAEEMASKYVWLSGMANKFHMFAYLGLKAFSIIGRPVGGALAGMAADAMGEGEILENSPVWAGIKAFSNEAEELSNRYCLTHDAINDLAFRYGNRFGQWLVGSGDSNGGSEGPAVATLMKGAANATSGANSWTQLVAMSAPGSHVYVGRNKAKRIVYVGITQNFTARASAHLRSQGIVIEKITPPAGMRRLEARAIETAIIEHHMYGEGSFRLRNKNRSISENRSFFHDAMEFGEDWLNRHGRRFLK